MNPSIALITGGSRGLGRNASLALASRGVDVILTYVNNAAAAEAVVEEIRARGANAAALQLDVGKPATFTAFRDSLAQVLETHWGRSDFDHLVNNAGTGLTASFAETSEDDFDTMMRIHLKGPYFLTQTLLPLIRDGGSVLNVSSGLARFSVPGYSAYAMMKGGIEVLTRYQAKELGERKIRVNAIAPGAIETDFHGGMVRDNKEMNAFIASQTALGRAGLPDDIGGVIANLLSDDSRWVNAQRLEVSGGMFV